MTQEQKQTTEHLNEGFRFLETEYENLLKKHNTLLDAADKMAEALEKTLNSLNDWHVANDSQVAEEDEMLLANGDDALIAYMMFRL